MGEFEEGRDGDGFVFLKVVSALHTAVMALLSFFRSITLKDVGNAIAVAVKALC